MNDGLSLALGVAVRRVRRDDVANPSERSSASDPQAGRDDQPEESAQKFAVVELAHTRNEKRQYGSDTRIGNLRVRHVAAQCAHETGTAQ